MLGEGIGAEQCDYESLCGQALRLEQARGSKRGWYFHGKLYNLTTEEITYRSSQITVNLCLVPPPLPPFIYTTTIWQQIYYFKFVLLQSWAGLRQGQSL